MARKCYLDDRREAILRRDYPTSRSVLDILEEINSDGNPPWRQKGMQRIASSLGLARPKQLTVFQSRQGIWERDDPRPIHRKMDARFCAAMRDRGISFEGRV